MGNPKIIQGMGKSVTKKGKFERVFWYDLTVSVLCLYIWVSHRTLHYKNRGHDPPIDLLGWCSFRHVRKTKPKDDDLKEYILNCSRSSLRGFCFSGVAPQRKGRC